MSGLLRKLAGLKRNSPPTATSYISKQLLTPEAWSYEGLAKHRAEFLSTKVGSLWKDIPNGHKWLNYFPVYEECLWRFVGKQPKILEIGVDKGASLLLWTRYFGHGTKMVGVDILPECATYERPGDGIFVRIGSQADAKFLARVIVEFGPFDLIIDDGSHVASHQIAAFNALFDDGLMEDGVYLIEDIETAYWGKRTGQLDIDVSIVDFAEAIVDLMHYPYTAEDYGFFLIQNLREDSGLIVPRITKLIDQIRFFDSIIVFYKKHRVPPFVEHLR